MDVPADLIIVGAQHAKREGGRGARATGPRPRCAMLFGVCVALALVVTGTHGLVPCCEAGISFKRAFHRNAIFMMLQGLGVGACSGILRKLDRTLRMWTACGSPKRMLAVIADYANL